MDQETILAPDPLEQWVSHAMRGAVLKSLSDPHSGAFTGFRAHQPTLQLFSFGSTQQEALHSLEVIVAEYICTALSTGLSIPQVKHDPQPPSAPSL